MNYWLIKSEPEAFSLEDFQKQKTVIWDGVRNYTARNNIRAMQLNDICIFYRSVEKPALIALCKVIKDHFPDPTSDNPAWLSVELELTELAGAKRTWNLTKDIIAGVNDSANPYPDQFGNKSAWRSPLLNAVTNGFRAAGANSIKNERQAT